jgi:hypothetical protein
LLNAEKLPTLIKRVSSDVLESDKSDKAVQAGETSQVISAEVDSKIIRT